MQIQRYYFTGNWIEIADDFEFAFTVHSLVMHKMVIETFYDSSIIVLWN